MSTWHVQTHNAAISSDGGTRAESDTAPILNEQWIWEFREGGKVTLLVPNVCVAYIKRVDK